MSFGKASHARLPSSAARPPLPAARPTIRWDLYWRWLHRQAIAYPRKPTREDAIRTFHRMWTFFTELPCDKCRAHVAVYLNAHPINLASSDDLQLWVWELHNAVNARLKKPFFTYEAYRVLYAEDISNARSMKPFGG